MKDLYIYILVSSLIFYFYDLAVEKDITCNGCEYPICSDICASKHSNHTTEECEILSRCPENKRPEILRINKDRTKVSHAYSIITPLRMLLLMRRDNDAWKKSDQLIDHISGMCFYWELALEY